MSLSQKIGAEVDELMQSHAAPRSIRAEDGPYRLDVPIDMATPVGIECRGFEFAATDRADRSVEDLRAWGSRLAVRITYLMEPLAETEVDDSAGVVMLRSQSPTNRRGGRSYFEIKLDRAGTLRFDRFVFDEASRRRRPQPCQFTAETFDRLVDDLVASAS